ncbi:phage tail protein [Vibrio navarrensis]|uniref:Phage tail protein n=1 Tax=Vibrio navarrensis TaxID=29495 RepID=A0AAI9CVT6_9VIBR|nr:phage tail protein [Vibrio navarrensis]ELN6933159.1 phage tail protein [Vibrio navarrensis]
MSTRFMSEITLFAGNYAPQQWAYCYGTILAISGNEALYSLIGTNFGGDGRSSFGLPDLRGRVAVGNGSGPGLTPRGLGQMFGAETVTLDLTQIPGHSHNFNVSTSAASEMSPQGNVLASADQYVAVQSSDNLVLMKGSAIGSTGAEAAHNNMAPFLALNFIICTAGVYPPRN